MTGPLTGFHVAVTAARKADEQIALLERRGATVEHAPALTLDPHRVDEARLREATERVIADPPDMFLATTGIGMKAWVAAAEGWGLRDQLVAALSSAEILARATFEEADYMGLGDTLGSIEPGKLADFILLPGNPVEDLKAIKTIRLVSKGDTVYFPSEIYPEFGITPFTDVPGVSGNN